MWNQVYNPLGNAALSTIAAAIPVVLLLVIGLFCGCAAAMMGWSVKAGQFENADRNSKCIFDEDEPVGTPTDRKL